MQDKSQLKKIKENEAIGFPGRKTKKLMKNIISTIVSLSFLFFSSNNIHAQTIKYQVAQKPWISGLGNHRAILNINKPADAVGLKITWRLHDLHPDKKRFLIINATTGDTIQNVYKISVSDEQCDIAFGPVTKPGKYYFYYLPYKPDTNAGYYQYGYLFPKMPDAEWVEKNHLSDKNNISKLTSANCDVLESRTGFDSFYPMELIATNSEKKKFLSKHNDGYLLFPEDRKYPIKMQDDIPLKWIKEGPQKEFRGEAERNEYYTFQLGLYATQSDVDSVQVSFSDLKNKQQMIPSSALTCFNTEGINSYGKPFTKRLNVSQGNVQALWMGIDIPADVKPGIYEGAVIVSTLGEKTKRIPLQITITDNYQADRGDGETWRYSRLRWLNSTAGISDKPTIPFTPINFDGQSQFSFSEKQVTSTADALPASINVSGTKILAGPIQCIASGENFNQPDFGETQQDDGKVAGSWTAYSNNFLLKGKGSLQFDGYLHYTIQLKALHDISLNDFRLEIPLRKEVAQYMMGMGLPGTLVPDTLDAKWKGPHNSFWIGNTYGGIYCQLLGATYAGPLLNLYHPAPPSSWYNENKGGFSIRNNGDTTLATVYSGSRNFRKDEEVSFEFDLIITPIKKIRYQSSIHRTILPQWWLCMA